MVWVRVLLAAIVPAMALGTPVTAHKIPMSQDPEIIGFFSGACMKYYNLENKIPDATGTTDKAQTCTESITEGKNCSPKQQLRNCTHKALNIISECSNIASMKESEKDRDIYTVANRYSCQNEGERLSAFVKAGGSQCIQDNFDSLMMCLDFIKDQMNKTFQNPQEKYDVCKHDVSNIINCVLSSISSCGETPVKMANDLADYHYNITKCNKSEEAFRTEYNQWLESRSKLN